jgi:addiction module HigA family antidote
MTYGLDNLPPIHPGEFLRDEIEALGISARRLAAHIRVAPNAVAAILDGRRSITAQMAIRLGLAFGKTPLFWVNLQTMHDLKRARHEMPAEALRIEAL